MSFRNVSVWACVPLIAIGAFGCTAKREGVEQRQQTSGKLQIGTPSDSGARGVSPASDPGARGVSPAPDRAVVDTVSSVAEVFSRIHQYESSLSQIIAAGRLNELRADASRINELLATASHLAQVPPDQRGDFEGHVSAAERAARALGDAGMAGSLEESKAENAILQRELGIVERLAHAGT